MDTNRERTEKALERLRAAADKASEAVKGGNIHEDTLRVVRRLTPGSLDMAMTLHVELADNMEEDLSLCGCVTIELAEVLNGLKALMEETDGDWFFENGRWHNRTEHFKEVLARGLPKVAK